MKRIIAVAAVLVAASALAIAQTTTTSTPGRNKGGSTARIRRFVSAVPRFQIALRNEVRTHLNIDAKASNDMIRATMAVKRDDWDKSGDPEGAYKRWQANSDVAMSRFLKPEQQKRLTELFVQLNGALAITDYQIAKAIGLSDAQREQIKEILRTANLKLRDADRDPKNGPMAPEKVRELNTQVQDDLKKVMSPEQAKALEALGGEKFDFTPAARKGE